MQRFGLLLAVVAAALIAVAAAGADQTYTDVAGDAGPGTDITAVNVSNDQAGTIVFKVSAANPIPANHAIFVFIDADKNAGTGDTGDEYLLIGIAGRAIPLQWNGSDYTPATLGSLRTILNGNVMEFDISKNDLANTASFNFDVASGSVDGDSFTFRDFAPESGKFAYDLVYPQCSNGKDDDGDGKVDSADLGCSGPTDDNESDDPVHVKLGAAKTTPVHPKAGLFATVSAPATRVETSEALTSGAVKCAAKIVGGAALRGTGSVVGGRAQCKFKIPKTARNKLVRGQIGLTYQTAPPAVAAFSFRTAK